MTYGWDELNSNHFLQIAEKTLEALERTFSAIGKTNINRYRNQYGSPLVFTIVVSASNASSGPHFHADLWEGLIKASLRHGANPNLRAPKTTESMTPLHALGINNDAFEQKMELLLLQYGADPFLVDANGEMPAGQISEEARKKITYTNGLKKEERALKAQVDEHKNASEPTGSTLKPRSRSTIKRKI